MFSHTFTDDEVNDLISRYADESFRLNDAVRFEVLLRQRPCIRTEAETNRVIRSALAILPRVEAKPGFEERLRLRLEREERSSVK